MNDHRVQFYSGDHAVLAATVGQYLAEGLKHGSAAIVIATPEHTRAFKQVVGDHGIDHTRIIALDAAQTLASFMEKRKPDWNLFQAAMKPIFDRAGENANGAGIRAYGEMVDLLWQEGNLAGAIELEGCWNRLLECRNASLFCAYQSSALDVQLGGVQAVLQAHSHLVSSGNGKLEKAVVYAMKDVLGADEVAALAPLIAANLTRGAKLPWAEAAVMWLKNHLPNEADAVIKKTRTRLAEAV